MEGFLRIGTDLLTSIDKVDQSLGLAPAPQLGDDGEPVPGPEENAAALRELETLMKGLV